MNSDIESNRPLVLVVDDNEKITTGLHGLFQTDNNIEVRYARTSEGAIDLVLDLDRPAVLFLDQRLKNRKGEEIYGEDLLSTLRERARYPVTTIFYSFDNSNATKLRAYSKGAYWYLVKGDDDELLVAIFWLAISIANRVSESKFDFLTGTLGRHLMQETVIRGLFRAMRLSSTTAFLLFDIDNFKSVNDTYGHDTGDVAIISIARSIQEHLRGADALCRSGGDEFQVVLFDVEPESLPSFLEKAQAAISSKEIPISSDHSEKGTINVSASVGCAILTPERIDEAMRREGLLHKGVIDQHKVLATLMRDILNEADQTMYLAKKAKGR